MRSLHPIWGYLLALACLSGCAQPSEPRIDHLDFLAGDRLSSSLESAEPEQVFCADELRWARTVRPDERLSAIVEVAGSPRLFVSGCMPRPTPGAEIGDGVLEIEVRRSGAPPELHEIPLPRYSRAFREEVDLADLAPGPANLSFTARLPAGRQLVLSDLALSHVERVPARKAPQPPQVLLISVDTFRADAIAALGGPWPTPNLDRLVAESEVWDPHYAASHWTKPSHASLLTGQSPEVHGAGSESGVMQRGVSTLAERLRKAGFLTAGLVFDCLWLNPRFGFSRGYDEYRSVHWNLPQMVRHAGDWMSAHREHSFFFFFHTFEVHSDFRRLPYEAPDVTLRTIEERFGVKRYGCREKACASSLLARLDDGRIDPLPEEAEILEYLYGAGVTHLDEGLGELFDRLRADGIYDDLMIVLTADHGESLLDRSTATLHAGPWEEVLRVPLIVKWPGGRSAGTRRQERSSALDVMPTILAAMGVEAGDLPGTPLGAARPDRPVFSWGFFRTVWADELKATVFDLTDERRLFDLVADPEERSDLAAERRDDLERLERLLASRQAVDEQLREETRASGSVPDAELSSEERARLQALGYLGDS